MIGTRESQTAPLKINMVNKGKLEGVISDMNIVLGVIEMANIENTNDIILARALMVTKKLRIVMKTRSTPGNKQKNVPVDLLSINIISATSFPHSSIHIIHYDSFIALGDVS